VCALLTDGDAVGKYSKCYDIFRKLKFTRQHWVWFAETKLEVILVLPTCLRCGSEISVDHGFQKTGQARFDQHIDN